MEKLTDMYKPGMDGQDNRAFVCQDYIKNARESCRKYHQEHRNPISATNKSRERKREKKRSLRWCSLQDSASVIGFQASSFFALLLLLLRVSFPGTSAQAFVFSTVHTENEKDGNNGEKNLQQEMDRGRRFLREATTHTHTCVRGKS